MDSCLESETLFFYIHLILQYASFLYFRAILTFFPIISLIIVWYAFSFFILELLVLLLISALIIVYSSITCLHVPGTWQNFLPTDSSSKSLSSEKSKNLAYLFLRFFFFFLLCERMIFLIFNTGISIEWIGPPK